MATPRYSRSAWQARNHGKLVLAIEERERVRVLKHGLHDLLKRGSPGSKRRPIVGGLLRCSPSRRHRVQHHQEQGWIACRHDQCIRASTSRAGATARAHGRGASAKWRVVREVTSISRSVAASRRSSPLCIRRCSIGGTPCAFMMCCFNDSTVSSLATRTSRMLFVRSTLMYTTMRLRDCTQTIVSPIASATVLPYKGALLHHLFAFLVFLHCDDPQMAAGTAAVWKWCCAVGGLGAAIGRREPAARN